MSVGGEKPFGLNDLKVTDLPATTQQDLPQAMTLEFTPRFQTGELLGDDSMAAVVSRLIALDWSLSAGGLDLDAAAIMLGYTVASSGSTPNQQDTLDLDADCMPYFQIYGKALGDDCKDDLHALIYKAKVTSWSGKLENGAFLITECSGVAIDDGSHGVIRLIQHETAAAVPGV